MIEINLLPSGETRRSARKRSKPQRASTQVSVPRGDPWNMGLAAAGLAVLLAVSGTFWYTSATQSRLEGQVARAAADSTRYATTIELVNSLRARQDTIQQKINVIRSVDTRRYVWSRMLDEISRSVPAFIWMHRMTSVETRDTLAGGPRITLEGAAGSTQALTRFMKNLESSPFIRDVTLVTTEQATAEGRTFNRFTLEAQYEKPDSAFIETIPVVIVSN